MSTNSPGKAGVERVAFRAGTRPSAAQFERALRILFGARGTGDCIVRLNENGLVVHVPPRRRAAESEVAFSGTAYIAGNKTTGLNSDSAKPWVRCFLDTATAEENAGPPPNPFPMNEEWYEKAQTAGDIHIPRA